MESRYTGMTGGRRMRIGELAKAVGVNPKTIRYYESIEHSGAEYFDARKVAINRRRGRLDVVPSASGWRQATDDATVNIRCARRCSRPSQWCRMRAARYRNQGPRSSSSCFRRSASRRCTVAPLR